MRIIAGKTVRHFEKRLARLELMDDAVHSVHRFLHNLVDGHGERFANAKRQAIADRQAAIRVASEEIAQLENF